MEEQVIKGQAITPIQVEGMTLGILATKSIVPRKMTGRISLGRSMGYWVYNFVSQLLQSQPSNLFQVGMKQ